MAAVIKKGGRHPAKRWVLLGYTASLPAAVGLLLSSAPPCWVALLVALLPDSGLVVYFFVRAGKQYIRPAAQFTAEHLIEI